jgi:hypothetical protein
LTCLERTTLAGRVKHEVNCIAVDNTETAHLLAIMTQEAMKPKNLTKFIPDEISSNNPSYIQPGTISAMNTFGGFIVRLLYSNMRTVLTSDLREQSLPLEATDHSSSNILVYLKMSFLIRYSTVSEDTTTGP